MATMTAAATPGTESLTAAEAARVLQTLTAENEAAEAPAPAGGERTLLEFVSANPNGPLSALHGRGGVLGDALAALLAHAGADVTREFYVNDATNSRQMRLFGHSVLAQCRRLAGQEAPPSDDNYPDEYVAHVARALMATGGDRLPALPEAQALAEVQQAAARQIRNEQEATLAALGIRFDQWVFESSLHTRGLVARVLQRLRDSGHAYEQSGALWLRSSELGDDADRTLVRADGSPTYLAGDLAYHAEKFERGYRRLVDVWSVDHAGYVDRTRAGLTALGYDADRLHIVLHGPVRLLKDGTEVKGSRFGGGVTLAEVLEEAPGEFTRLSLLLAPVTAPADVNVDRAAVEDSSNPAAYIKGVARRAILAGDSAPAAAPPDPLTPSEKDLILTLRSFPDTARRAADTLNPAPVAEAALAVARGYDAAGGRWPLLARATGGTLLLALRLLGAPLTGADLA